MYNPIVYKSGDLFSNFHISLSIVLFLRHRLLKWHEWRCIKLSRFYLFDHYYDREGFDEKKVSHLLPPPRSRLIKRSWYLNIIIFIYGYHIVFLIHNLTQADLKVKNQPLKETRWIVAFVARRFWHYEISPQIRFYGYNNIRHKLGLICYKTMNLFFHKMFFGYNFHRFGVRVALAC